MYSKKIYENVHVNVSYDFSKFNGVNQNSLWTSTFTTDTLTNSNWASDTYWTGSDSITYSNWTDDTYWTGNDNITGSNQTGDTS
jgi:hypothetical protein